MQKVTEGPGSSIYRQPEYASAYDADRFGKRFGRYLEDQEVELFRGMLDGSSKSILDAGAGTGKLCIPLLESGSDVTATDFSLEMLQIAGRKGAGKGLPGKFSIADIQALCFKDRAFECTVCSRVLMHLRDWQAGIAEMCRVTRSVVIVDFPPCVSFAGLDAFRKRKRHGQSTGARQGYRSFFLRDVVEEFERHRFSVMDVRRGYCFPLLFHRWLDRPSLSTRIEGLFRGLGLLPLVGAPVTLKAVRQAELGPLNRKSHRELS